MLRVGRSGRGQEADFSIFHRISVALYVRASSLSISVNAKYSCIREGFMVAVLTVYAQRECQSHRKPKETLILPPGARTVRSRNPRNLPRPAVVAP